MAVCVLLTTLSEEGKKNLREHPEKLKEFKKEMEALGVTVRNQFVLIGQYDLLDIFEGESKEAVCKAALNLSSRGISQVVSLMGITVDEFMEYVKKGVQYACYCCFPSLFHGSFHRSLLAKTL